jgi:hypothetical protein
MEVVPWVYVLIGRQASEAFTSNFLRDVPGLVFWLGIGSSVASGCISGSETEGVLLLVGELEDIFAGYGFRSGGGSQ